MEIDLLANKQVIGYNVVNRLGETVWGSDSRSACESFIGNYWEKDCMITTVYGRPAKMLAKKEHQEPIRDTEPQQGKKARFEYVVTNRETRRIYTGTAKTLSNLLGVSAETLSNYFRAGKVAEKGKMKNLIVTRREV